MKRAMISCVVLLTLAACSKMSTPTEATLGTGTVTATVVDASTHAGVANATLEVRRSEDGPLAASAMTNSAGFAEVRVPAGSYFVRVVPPLGYSYAGGR